MALRSPPERQIAPAPTAEPPAPAPLSPQVVRNNYRLGVVNGVLFAFGDSLTSAGLVLALLVRQLGGSLALVGLLPALQSGGFLLPQLLVGGRLQATGYTRSENRRYHASASRGSAGSSMLVKPALCRPHASY